MYVAAPSKPLNLTATTTDTSATLSWDPPLSNGGLDDVFYLIKYKASEEQQFTYYSPTPPITNTSATVTSLAPLTVYIFMVVAENGVSQVFPDLFTESDRTSSAIFATTKKSDQEDGILPFLWNAKYFAALHCTDTADFTALIMFPFVFFPTAT